MANVIEPDSSSLYRGIPTATSNPEEEVQLISTTNIARNSNKCRNGDRALFPVKLHNFLTDVCTTEVDQNAYNAIRWSPNGRSFRIIHTYNFEVHILPKYFNLNLLRSFYRQLNLYGFKRITSREDSGCYEHPRFIRGEMSICVEMRRQKIKGTGNKRKKSSDDDDEPPDFYSMPSLPEQRPLKMTNTGRGCYPPQQKAGGGSYLRNIIRPAQAQATAMSAANPMGNVLANPGAATAAQLLYLNQQQQPWATTGAAAQPNYGAQQPSIQQLQLEIAKRDMLLNIQRHQMLNMATPAGTFSADVNPSSFAALGQFDQGLINQNHNHLTPNSSVNMYGNYGNANNNAMSSMPTCCRNARGCPCCNAKKSLDATPAAPKQMATQRCSSSLGASDDACSISISSGTNINPDAGFCNVLEPTPVSVFEPNNNNGGTYSGGAGYSSALPNQQFQQGQEMVDYDDSRVENICTVSVSNTGNHGTTPSFAGNFFTDAECEQPNWRENCNDVTRNDMNVRRNSSSMDTNVRGVRRDSVSELSLFGNEFDFSNQAFQQAGRRESGNSFFGAVREVEELLEADELFPC